MIQRKFAVIGHPIGHSMSPFLNCRLFALSNVSADYETLDIPPEKLRQSLSQLRLLDGFNVTIPHKQNIIPLLDSVDAKAAYFGSVNTVKNENGLLVGYTTDGMGFRYALDCAGISLNGRVLVLGCGGVSRVMAYEIASVSPNPEITLVTRESSLQKAEALRGELERHLVQLKKSGCIKITTFSRLTEETFALGTSHKGSYNLLVNGTSVGMFPNITACPIDKIVIQRCQAVFDAVYNPNETVLLKTAKQYGIPVVHGIDMLVGQAAEAHRIWDGATYSERDLRQLRTDALIQMEKLFSKKGETTHA